jgi:hypothetical protein
LRIWLAIVYVFAGKVRIGKAKTGAFGRGLIKDGKRLLLEVVGAVFLLFLLLLLLRRVNLAVSLVLLRELSVASCPLRRMALLSYNLLLQDGVVSNFLNFRA